MYETSSLFDAAFLASRGHQLLHTELRGDLVVFTVDVTEEQAKALFRSPERKICEAYSRERWYLRREIARLQPAGGRG